MQAALAPTRNPLSQSLGDEFQAIVGTTIPRNALQNEQANQNVDDINNLKLSLDTDSYTFSHEVVDHV